MSNDRPLIFVDLDDTLFQTARKTPADIEKHVATLDVSGNANGYMTNVQKSFAHWLLAHSDVVPVTARSVEAYSRVKLPFTAGAICSHGGVILDVMGRLDPAWNEQMKLTLAVYQSRLPELSAATLAIGQEMGFSLRGWVVEEAQLFHYVVTKHNESDDSILTQVLAEVQARGLLDDMHVHGNGNNLAFLPEGLAKRYAVQEWLRRDKAINGERPVLGFGDSITDLGFMDECHWWATPARSQLAKMFVGAAHE
ncbi:trehalose-phosphatase [Pseudomonas syringae]|uniref:HAD family hydrolase n=3 Tax=Pseudomonas syringae TaxID=317 RepID=UPI000420FAD9|nr:trehalose-phosphatase [Pseudomonas syringae]MCF5468623.1 trehalose phosphatase [Pseudomonas syringae]MCF5472439.1 trehalose phosphatase [Pseudomonas syringae]MCF5485145.1 trehalose phosphatase [Pseudomonas syringae]MCF5486483.1 trehalose phosphatase [Pseudomonas syringae]MCF5492243.1 trehalose phosphatase [Pseudomonas syringae]